MVGGPSRRSVAVIGGGVSGLAAAEALIDSGRLRVTLFEQKDALGGLCAGVRLGDLECDRFYHVMLPGDGETKAWIRRFGLENDLYYSGAGSGFYGEGRLAPLETIADFLRFPFLSLFEKLRLGCGIAALPLSPNPEGASSRTIEDWLRARFGKRVTEKIWMPLVRSKLGDAAPRTSAAFLRATIGRLQSSRRGPSGRERLAMLRGGVHSLIAAAEKHSQAAGVTIRTECPVLSVAGDRERKVVLKTNDGEQRFDAAVLAVPMPTLPEGLHVRSADGQKVRFPRFEYLGVIVLAAVVRAPLSPFYVINILDAGLPFTGIIEATNALPRGIYGGRALIYAPKYVLADDPANSQTDESVAARFISGLRRVFPGLRAEDVLAVRILRDRWVQPIAAPGPAAVPGVPRTSVSGIYLAGGALRPCDPQNMDASLALGRAAARALIDDFDDEPAGHA
jgi:protoporphyrinogen oxidase